MTMQSSGALTFNEVNLELRNTSLASISLNDARVRSLAQKSSGAISFADFYNRNFDIKGQNNYTSTGTYTWTCPADVTSISVVCIGGGGGGFVSDDGGTGGGGGGLGWDAAISVTPNSTYTVVVGGGSGVNSVSVGGTSYFINTSTVAGYGGTGGYIGGVGSPRAGGSYVGDGGGSGGASYYPALNAEVGGGGGGAGGYAGNGGHGSYVGGTNGQDGSGGGGGGAGGGYYNGGRGGGTGIYGRGSNGVGGAYTGGTGVSGTAGSSGSGALYGGGGGGSDEGSASAGTNGAVRIVWGENRIYSGSTQTIPDVTNGEYFE